MQEVKELIETLGEEVLVDNNNTKALVEFGRDERGFETKILTFVSFADSYENVVFRNKTYKVLDIFVDEFNIARVVLGEENV